jgi:hypothetical protein
MSGWDEILPDGQAAAEEAAGDGSAALGSGISDLQSSVGEVKNQATETVGQVQGYASQAQELADQMKAGDFSGVAGAIGGPEAEGYTAMVQNFINEAPGMLSSLADALTGTYTKMEDFSKKASSVMSSVFGFLMSDADKWWNDNVAWTDQDYGAGGLWLGFMQRDFYNQPAAWSDTDNFFANRFYSGFGKAANVQIHEFKNWLLKNEKWKTVKSECIAAAFLDLKNNLNQEALSGMRWVKGTGATYSPADTSGVTAAQAKLAAAKAALAAAQAKQKTVAAQAAQTEQSNTLLYVGAAIAAAWWLL